LRSGTPDNFEFPIELVGILYNIKPNQRKLKTMNDFHQKICPNCGGTRFTEYIDLDFEERIIADRMATKTENGPKDNKHLVCTRCFSELTKIDARA